LTRKENKQKTRIRNAGVEDEKRHYDEKSEPEDYNKQ
jgi:hypothetical protein